MKQQKAAVHVRLTVEHVHPSVATEHANLGKAVLIALRIVVPAPRSVGISSVRKVRIVAVVPWTVVSARTAEMANASILKTVKPVLPTVMTKIALIVVEMHYALVQKLVKTVLETAEIVKFVVMVSAALGKTV